MIPTISYISPNRIYTGGQLITINGTGFQTAYPIDPATPHPWPTPAPTVSVTVNGRPAIRVKVWSSTKVTCLAPSGDHGATTVQIKNLQANGTPIVGEVVSSMTTLTYVRVDLTQTSDLSRVIDALVSELKRQVIDNVSILQSVDFDEVDPAEVSFVGVDVTKLPALALTGPTLQKNKFYNDLRPVNAEGDGTFSRRSTLVTYDLGFRLTGLDNHTRRSLNLQALVTQFFKTNNYLSVPRDTSDLSKGFVRYELESDGMDNTAINSSNDLRIFMGSVTVIGFQFEDVAGFSSQSVAETTSAADDFRVQSRGI
jgi:hypothetical protein